MIKITNIVALLLLAILGREIEPAPGATPAPGRELTFLEQVIGNVGRFNKSGGTSTSSGSGDNTPSGRPYEPGDPNKK